MQPSNDSGSEPADNQSTALPAVPPQQHEPAAPLQRPRPEVIQSAYPQPVNDMSKETPPAPVINPSFQSWNTQNGGGATPQNKLELSPDVSDQPVPVVKVLSVRGVEYAMMTIALWIGAGAMIWALLVLINGLSSFAALAMPISLLLVSVPVFSVLFVRLKRAELINPDLRYEASKRRMSQITQVAAFLVCVFNTIVTVYAILISFSGGSGPSVGKSLLNLLVVVTVAGGILAYYWFDEHRLINP